MSAPKPKTEVVVEDDGVDNSFVELAEGNLGKTPEAKPKGVADQLAEANASGDPAIVAKVEDALAEKYNIPGEKPSDKMKVAEDSQENVEEERKQFIRIPKLISMFASRACRSAIMIGTAMQHYEMKSVVGRLEKIEQPWNCPHGRPTMRHLVDLQSIRRKERKHPVSNLLKFTSSMPMSDEL